MGRMMVKDHVATIVLAAGYSSRMKGAFKPLLKFGDATIIERAIASHLNAGIRDIIVVVGYRADDVIDAVTHLGVTVVRNRHFKKGMFSSVQAGVAALTPTVKAFFIMPADIPLIDPATIRAILDGYKKNACGIVYPLYRGKRGHPPLIDRRHIDEIMESQAPDGLRGILKNHEAEARDIVVDDEAVLRDIDTMKDYHRLLSCRSGDTIPNPPQCLELLEEANVDESVRVHCCLVAAVACRLVRLLNNAGADLNQELVRAAALLHDIRRNEKEHAQAGAQFLRTYGYDGVADIVAVHMDIKSGRNSFPTEAEIVYLADKLVMGRHCVPFSERFAAALERHKGNKEAHESILRRRTQAEKIIKKVERIIGCALDTIPPVTATGLEKEAIREA